jgi:putative PIN family toxin of toxin-antitoxin system
MDRIVLDTNVLVSGSRSRRGASFALLQLIGRQKVRPLLTTALVLEYQAVLNRIEHSSVHGLSMAEVDRFLSGLATLAEPVDLYFRWRPQLYDPQDEMVLEAAINGRADALISYNRRHFETAAARFGVKVFIPAEFLKGFKHE